MMMQLNPYQSPSALVGATDAGSSPSTEVPAAILGQLKKTKPWATFLGMLGLISSAICLLGGVAAITSPTILAAAQLPAFIGPLYIAIALVGLIPSIHLVRYGSSITRLLRDGAMTSLEAALGHQRAYWRFVGYLMLVFTVLYVLFFGGILIASIARLGGS